MSKKLLELIFALEGLGERLAWALLVIVAGLMLFGRVI